jgi:hypothetical protein
MVLTVVIIFVISGLLAAFLAPIGVIGVSRKCCPNCGQTIKHIAGRGGVSIL